MRDNRPAYGLGGERTTQLRFALRCTCRERDEDAIEREHRSLCADGDATGNVADDRTEQFRGRQQTISPQPIVDEGVDDAIEPRGVMKDLVDEMSHVCPWAGL